jgi:DNA-binding phage protein
MACHGCQYAYYIAMDDLRTLVARHGGQSAFARMLGCSRQDIHRVVRKKDPFRLSSPLAIRIYVRFGQMFDAHGKPLTPDQG